jgi:hypothetical protein
MGRHLSLAPTPSRQTAWEAWIRRWNHTPLSASTTNGTQCVRARMSNEIIHYRMTTSQVIRWQPDATLCIVKPGTRTQSCTANKSFITSHWAVSHHSEARVSEGADSLSAPCATLSGPNHVALRACIHSNRSHQLFIKSSNRTQKWRHDDSDAIAS